jgi:hypothetical protein
LRRFFKSDRPPRRRLSVSFVSFSLRSFCQRKAAKDFGYQSGYNAFSFEKVAPKEKALQKENGVFSLKPLGSRF